MVAEPNFIEVIEKEIKAVESSLQEVEDFYKRDLRRLDRFSDKIAEVGGSWTFILLFFVFLFGWIGINSWLLLARPFDPFPYILLNLLLSTLAAIQAPLILMSQTRTAKRDQIRLEMDLEKDLRDLHIDQQSHVILLGLRRDMDKVKKKLGLK